MNELYHGRLERFKIIVIRLNNCYLAVPGLDGAGPGDQACWESSCANPDSLGEG